MGDRSGDLQNQSLKTIRRAATLRQDNRQKEKSAYWLKERNRADAKLENLLSIRLT